VQTSLLKVQCCHVVSITLNCSNIRCNTFYALYLGRGYCHISFVEFQTCLSHYLVCSTYQEYGAELRILSSDPLQTECPKIVYLVRSQLSFMKFIASQIRNDESKGLQREYFLYFVPRRTVACEKVSLVLFYVWTNPFRCSSLLFFAGGLVCWTLE
jgi:hypothetical protein